MRELDSIHSAASRFTVAAVALIATLLGLLHPAAAQIVYTPVDIQIYDSIYSLDVNNDGITDFSIASFQGKICNCKGGGCWHTWGIDETTLGGNGVVGNPPSPLKLGREIGPKQVFYQGKGYLIYGLVSCGGKLTREGKWGGRNVKTAYLGLSFQINGETHYGWAEITLNGGVDATLTGYAYEATAGKSLTAGQTH